MYEYRHNIITGRIVIDNDAMRELANKLYGLLNDFPEADNIDNFKQVDMCFTELDGEDTVKAFEFYANISGRGENWSFAFIDKVCESFVNAEMPINSLTYIVHICDSTNLNECNCKVYGNTQVVCCPYSAENANKVFGTATPKFTSSHQLDIQITMARKEWTRLFDGDDWAVLFKKSHEHNKEAEESREKITYKLYKTFGKAICVDKVQPLECMRNVSCYDVYGRVKGIVSDDVTVCLMPSDSFWEIPENLLEAQVYAKKIMKSYDGHIKYTFLFDGDGILLPDGDLSRKCPAFVRYTRDKGGNISGAEIVYCQIPKGLNNFVEG